jgi:hypothetical protein
VAGRNHRGITGHNTELDFANDHMRATIMAAVQAMGCSFGPEEDDGVGGGRRVKTQKEQWESFLAQRFPYITSLDSFGTRAGKERMDRVEMESMIKVGRWIGTLEGMAESDAKANGLVGGGGQGRGAAAAEEPVTSPGGTARPMTAYAALRYGNVPTRYQSHGFPCTEDWHTASTELKAGLSTDEAEAYLQLNLRSAGLSMSPQQQQQHRHKQQRRRASISASSNSPMISMRGGSKSSADLLACNNDGSLSQPSLRNSSALRKHAKLSFGY